MTKVRTGRVLLAVCFWAVIGGLSITHLPSIDISAKLFIQNSESRIKGPEPPSGLIMVPPTPSQKMTLVFVICENHFNIGLVAIKSAVAYSYTPMHLVVFADNRNLRKMKNQYASWPETIKRRVTFEVRPVWFPKHDTHAWWATLRPCSTQRLLLPSMLPDVDAMLYADTDVVFVHPVEDLWRIFYAMNEWQMAAMAPETESLTENYYIKKALYPFVKPFALNAGLLLMNLTRIRAFGLESRVLKLRQEFQGRIPWGDQDLLNILFARYPQGIFTLTCRWNFRFEHCLGSALCTDGPAAVVHGSRRQVLDVIEPAFIAVHESMQQYKLGDNLVEHFIQPLKERLSKAFVTGCTTEFQKQLHLWQLSASRVDTVSGRNASRRASSAATKWLPIRM